MKSTKNLTAKASPARRRPSREITEEEDDDGEEQAKVVRKPRSRVVMVLATISLGFGLMRMYSALGGDPRPLAPPSLPAVARTATAPRPTRTPAETAEWRAQQHALVEAARRDGDGARARGDFMLAARRFEDGFRASQEVMKQSAEGEEDGDMELDAAVMLVELADLERARGNEEEMTLRRRGADFFLKFARELGVKNQPLLDATFARAHAMGGPSAP